MFCYHGTCTNTKGDSLPDYYVECLSGSSVQAIYSDNSSTPIVTSSGVANRAKADSRGNFFFYVADGTYSLKYYDTNGVFQFSEDNFSMIGLDSVAAAEASAAAAAASAASAEADAAIAAAATNSRTANTTALISGIRNNAFHPKPSFRCATDDVATITVGTGGAVSTINGAAAGSANVSVTNTTKITWLCGTADKDVNNAYYARGAYYAGSRGRNYASYEFTHTGTQFDAQVLASEVSTAGSNFRVLVGDAIAGTAAISGTGSNYFVKVVFPVSATRRIRIEMAGGHHRGVNVASTAEVTGTGRTYPLATLIGDSFPEGTGTTQPFDGEGIALLRAVGINPALAAVGSTGLLNPGTGGRVNWQDTNRLDDLTLAGWTDKITSAGVTPNLGVIMLSINDYSLNSTYWGGAASFEEACEKALWVLVDRWNTDLAGKPLVIFGPTSPDGTLALDTIRLRDVGRRVCNSGGGNLFFIDRFGPDGLLRSGTVATGRTVTTGNTHTSTALDGLASTSNVVVGSDVLGSGIPTGTRVEAIVSSTAVTLSNAATTSLTGTAITFLNNLTGHYTSTSDSSHPNDWGHAHDALWCAEELRRLILAEFA